MRIDLHTHSDRSDGTLSPAEVVARAASLGLDVVALTDHDCFDGWDEAVEAAVDRKVTLVRGVEISCRYAGEGVHLLGYLPDPTYGPLVEELARVLEGRSSRLPAMLRRLQELGMDVTAADVQRVSPDAAATGRPHVADAMIAKGYVKDRGEAFDRYLSAGRPAYVDRYAADLVDMIGLVEDAGGVTVVAHPWAARHDTSALDEAAFARFKAAGLSGIEVDHQDHTPEKRAGLRAIAASLDLVVTGSSDFHGDGKVDHELGVNTTAPEQYHRLMALATDAAVASGRETPRVVVA